MATVNILLDCTCTAKFVAVDAGGGEDFSGAATTFKMDKVSLKVTKTSADHSTAQDDVEFHRKTKNSWEVSCETKLANATLLAALKSNELARFTVTALTGLGFTVDALITDFEPEYAGPSTLKFTLKPRGVMPTFS